MIFGYVTRSRYCYNRPVAGTRDRFEIKAIGKASLLFLASASVYPQSVAGPVFDVASVKPSASDERSGSSTMYSPTLQVKNVPLRSCIASAYEVKSRDVEGPGWLDTERFDITAKAPPGTSDSDFLKMYRALLADRFGLRVHTGTKEAPGFALKIAKGGIKLQDAGSQPLSEPRPVAQRSNASHIVSAAGMTMAALARQIEMRLNVPVVDMTGTPDYFVMNLEFRLPDPNDDAQGGGPDRPVLFAAIQDEAGLRLESMKVPVQTIVVDSVERKPTAN